LWLGPVFADESTAIMQAIAFGVFLNSLALVAYTAVQALGRPDVTAKFHLLELPVYILMVLFFIRELGILGVALAWVLRVILDAVLLFWFSYRILKLKQAAFHFFKLDVVFTACLFETAAYLLTLIPNELLKYGSFGFVLTLLLVYVWKIVLGVAERSYVKNLWVQLAGIKEILPNER
jgi:O-antigen/teichoic acid export membrane protein